MPRDAQLLVLDVGGLVEATLGDEMGGCERLGRVQPVLVPAVVHAVERAVPVQHAPGRDVEGGPKRPRERVDVDDGGTRHGQRGEPHVAGRDDVEDAQLATCRRLPGQDVTPRPPGGHARDLARDVRLAHDRLEEVQLEALEDEPRARAHAGGFVGHELRDGEERAKEVVDEAVLPRLVGASAPRLRDTAPARVHDGLCARGVAPARPVAHGCVHVLDGRGRDPRGQVREEVHGVVRHVAAAAVEPSHVVVRDVAGGGVEGEEAHVVGEGEPRARARVEPVPERVQVREYRGHLDESAGHVAGARVAQDDGAHSVVEHAAPGDLQRRAARTGRGRRAQRTVQVAKHVKREALGVEHDALAGLGGVGGVERRDEHAVAESDAARRLVGHDGLLTHEGARRHVAHGVVCVHRAVRPGVLKQAVHPVVHGAFPLLRPRGVSKGVERGQRARDAEHGLRQERGTRAPHAVEERVAVHGVARLGRVVGHDGLVGREEVQRGCRGVPAPRAPRLGVLGVLIVPCPDRQ
eukprot:3612564-Rhodomonas_salina.1